MPKKSMENLTESMLYVLMAFPVSYTHLSAAVSLYFPSNGTKVDPKADSSEGTS